MKFNIANAFANNARGVEYRLIRTKQFTYERNLKGPSKLFDNLKDPYQMDNLLGNPEYSDLQQELHNKLNKALEEVGDDFQPKEYYIKKWNLVFDEKKPAINFCGFKKIRNLGANLLHFVWYNQKLKKL